VAPVIRVYDLVILVYVHNRDQIFSEDTFQKLYNAFILYFKNETELTGYNPKVGWMHAIAHSADLFAQIVKSKEVNEAMLQEILYLIQEKFLIDSYTYISDEDERMVTAMVTALKQEKLSEQFLLDYIASFEETPDPLTFPEKYTFQLNKKNL